MNAGTVLRWVGRAWGLASGGLLLLFLFGGRENLRPTAEQAALMLFFPVGVLLGFAVAWRSDLAGGLITVGSLAGFYLAIAALGGAVPTTPYFLLFAGPGFLHLAAALAARRRKPLPAPH